MYRRFLCHAKEETSPGTENSGVTSQGLGREPGAPDQSLLQISVQGYPVHQSPYPCSPQYHLHACYHNSCQPTPSEDYNSYHSRSHHPGNLTDDMSINKHIHCYSCHRSQPQSYSEMRSPHLSPLEPQPSTLSNQSPDYYRQSTSSPSEYGQSLSSFQEFRTSPSNHQELGQSSLHEIHPRTIVDHVISQKYGPSVLDRQELNFSHSHEYIQPPRPIQFLRNQLEMRQSLPPRLEYIRSDRTNPSPSYPGILPPDPGLEAMNFSINHLSNPLTHQSPSLCSVSSISGAKISQSVQETSFIQHRGDRNEGLYQWTDRRSPSLTLPCSNSCAVPFSHQPYPIQEQSYYNPELINLQDFNLKEENNVLNPHMFMRNNNNDHVACTVCLQCDSHNRSTHKDDISEENGGKNSCTDDQISVLAGGSSAICKQNQGYQASSRKISSLVSRIL